MGDNHLTCMDRLKNTEDSQDPLFSYSSTLEIGLEEKNLYTYSIYPSIWAKTRTRENKGKRR